ncbi:MAG TPA: hypothetical protein VK132_10885 [Gemmatimonadales bacterium]|nr:hypothetical protein [Gemmatimonadales bacterium]
MGEDELVPSGVHPRGHFQKHPADPCLAIARRRPGESPEQLDARLQAVATGLSAKYGRPPGGVRVDVEPEPVRVDPDRHQAALHCVAWAAKLLDMRAPEVKWFARSLPMGDVYFAFYLWAWDVTGTVRGGGEIWLCSDLEGWVLAQACLEESVHAHRDLRGLLQDEESVKREAERLLTRYATEAITGRAATLIAEVSLR